MAMIIFVICHCPRAVLFTMSVNKKLFNEFNRRIELEINIVLFSKSVTFVLGHQKPNTTAILFDLIPHLNRLREGNTGIVAALYDKYRFLNLIRVVQWCC